jgi:hypothetical protein
MPDLVTVEQVNKALRLDLDMDVSGDDSDTSRVEDIEAKIEQATDIVLDYLKLDPEYVEWTAETVPGRVSAAIIMVVDCLLDDTPEKLDRLGGLSGGDIHNPIVALLYRLRDPALA